MEDVAGVGNNIPYALQVSITAGLDHCLRLIQRAEGKSPLSHPDNRFSGSRECQRKADEESPSPASI